MKKLITGACIAAALVAPAAPAAAAETEPIVQTYSCPPGYTGTIIHVGGRGLWWGCYRLP